MRINVIKWVNVLSIAQDNKIMLNAFLKFYARLKETEWKNPNDILRSFNDADLVKCENGNRIVFNIGGNKYRLVCGYHFGRKFTFLFVKFVGTHSQYDKIETCKIDMFKNE